MFFYKKVPVIVSPRFFLVLQKVFGFSFHAVALFPVIIVDKKSIFENKYYMNHEYIHILQYMETGIIGFFIISIIEFLYAHLFLKKSFIESYYYMSTEQEAHLNDENLAYTEKRRVFSVYRYMNPKNKTKIINEGGKRIIL